MEEKLKDIVKKGKRRRKRRTTKRKDRRKHPINKNRE